jgi:AraC family transcriptional regulator
MGVEQLGGGSFYGAVQGKQEIANVIFTDLHHRTARKMPLHSHELPFFALILDGNYAERYGRQQNHFGPFTLSFRPAGIPHQDEVGPRGVKFFEMEIRPEWSKRLQACGGSLDIPVDDYGGGNLLWLALRLFRETRAAVTADDLCVENLVAELLSSATHLPSENIKDAPSWLGRVIEKIEAQHCQKLTLTELSAEAGVHPVHLSRVFRKCKRDGIGDFIRRLRIKAACEKMLTPGNTLADISFDTGFADQSHFTRVFREFSGMSPEKFRRILRTACVTQ